MTVVQETLVLPGGEPAAFAVITVSLVGPDGAGYEPPDETIVATEKVRADIDGFWTIDLTPNDDIVPSGTVWRRVVTAARSSRQAVADDYLLVPASGGPYEVQEILTDPPDAVPSTALAAHEADPSNAHAASAIGLADLLGYFETTTPEGALAELGNLLELLSVRLRAEPIRLKTNDFILGQAGPVRELISGRWHGWTLRDANLDRINTQVDLSYLDYVDIDILWLVKASANAGDVCFNLHLNEGNVGDTGSTIITLPTTDADGKIIVTAVSGNEVLKRHRLAGRVDVRTDMLNLLMLTRVGNDALDTLAASISIIELIITPTPDENVLTEDGVWCWFNEPRLIADEATGKVYGGFVTQQGSIGIAALDVATGTATEFTLKSKLEVDDHDAAAVLRRDDGRLIAFYSRHSVAADPIYYRISTNPDDISAWGVEQSIDLAGLPDDQPCYPKPVKLGGNLVLIFRNALEQYATVSTDQGATWGTPFKLFAYGGSGNRGYVNLRPTDDGSRLDIITTTKHPTDGSDVDLYHCYVDDDAPIYTIRATDGTAISSLLALGLAPTTGLAPTALTQVYEASTNGDSWGWDITHDDTGNPVVAFATFPSDTAHAYHVARWDGAAWVDSTVLADAGGSFADRGSQPHYSGGIALASATSAYLSRRVAGQWEIERWDSADGGDTWQRAELVTRWSVGKQVRPTVPEYHYPGCPPVFWMSGWYTHYVRYGMRIVYADA